MNKYTIECLEIHHLSHIDLDGYGAQLIAKECFREIQFYNANYGKEVEVRIFDILNNIKQSKSKKYLILITDLNLTLQEANFLQYEVNLLNMNGKSIELMLLDHHITGKDCANVYDWYYLDSSVCASKLTFEALKEKFGFEVEVEAWLKEFCDMINAADTWCEDDKYFAFGKVAMGMIASSKEFSRFIFDDYDREFKLQMLYKAKDYMLDSTNTLIANSNVNLDNNIFLFKKELLGGDVNKQTMEEILSNKQVKLLSANKEEYTVYFNEKKGLLTYMIGGISVLANSFLNENSEYDFFMDISNRGAVSLRANGKCDVSELSKLCFNGGGHKNAAGGRFEGFKETFLYTQAKEQVNELFKQKEIR